MSLDRQSIEKRDFPLDKRGYDPAAVDAHLERVASEVDVLQRKQGRGESLATMASEQVRAIVDAAESSAGEIVRRAEQDAREADQHATRDADELRTEAERDAREHVTQVSESAAVMLQRIDAMGSELGALVEGLRTGANRLNADLSLLQNNMGDLRTVGQPALELPGGPVEAAEPVAIDAVPVDAFGPAPTPAGGPALAPDPPAAPEPPSVGSPAGHPAAEASTGTGFEPRFSSEPAAVDLEPAAVDPEPFGQHEVQIDTPPPADDPNDAAPVDPEPFGHHDLEIDPAPSAEALPSRPAGNEPGAVEGARLIALNMALNGTPREETDRYLEENFQLSDSRALLDEVYAHVDG